MNYRITMEEMHSAEKIAKWQLLWMPDNLTPDEREQHVNSLGWDKGYDSVDKFNNHAGQWHDCEGDLIQDCWGYSNEEIELYRDAYCQGRKSHLDMRKGIRKYGSYQAYNRIMTIESILES